MVNELPDDLRVKHDTAFQRQTGGTPTPADVPRADSQEHPRGVRNPAHTVSDRGPYELVNGSPVLRREFRGVLGDVGGHSIPLNTVLVVTTIVASGNQNWKPVPAAVRNNHQPRPTPYAGRMPRPHRPAPADSVDNWPNTPSTTPEVETARHVALNLRAALDGISLRQANRATGVDHTTIAAILNGTVWPDLHTLARLEHGLHTALWPASRPGTPGEP